MAKRKRGVVSVDTDGSIHGYFPSRAEAEILSGICHKDMGRALKNHYYTCKGYRWYYEEEYREGWFLYAEEHFAWIPSDTHKRAGSGFKKGHKLGNGYAQWSEEAKERKSEAVRRMCLMRKERGDYDAQGLKQRKPVICVTDGLKFDSIKSAGEHYGIPWHYISASLKRGGTTRNKKFEYDIPKTDNTW